MSTYWKLAVSAERDRSLRRPVDAFLEPGPPLVVWEEQTKTGWVVFLSRAPGRLSSFHYPDHASVEILLEQIDELYDELARKVQRAVGRER